MKRSSLPRWIAGVVLLGLLIATLVLDSITATFGYPIVAAIAALVMGMLHPAADGKLARWAARHGLRDRVGTTPETYPEYFELKKSRRFRAATVLFALIVVASYLATR